MVRHQVGQLLEPPQRELGQHPSLVGHRRVQDEVVRRDAVARHQQQLVVGRRTGRRVDRRVEVADLPGVDVDGSPGSCRAGRSSRGHSGTAADGRCRSGSARRATRSAPSRRTPPPAAAARSGRPSRRPTAPGRRDATTPPVVLPGAGVQHRDAGHAPGAAARPLMDVAGPRARPGSPPAASTTVTAASSLQRSGGTSSARPAGGRGQQQPAQRGAQPGQHDLGLRVAEPDVELDDLRAARRSGPARRRARRRTASPAGASPPPWAGPPARARRRPGAPAARAAASTPPCHRCSGRRCRRPARLKSWAGSSADDRRPVGQAEQRDLGPVEVLLDHHLLGPGETVPRVVDRLVAVEGHDDALATGQPVLLDDVRRAELLQRGLHLRGGAAGAAAPRSAHRPRP